MLYFTVAGPSSTGTTAGRFQHVCPCLAPSPASAAFRSQNTCWGLQVLFNKRRGPEPPAFAHLHLNKSRSNSILPKPNTWADEIVNGATSLRNSSGTPAVAPQHSMAVATSIKTTDEGSCNAMPAQVALPQMVTFSSCASSTNLEPGSLHVVQLTTGPLPAAQTGVVEESSQAPCPLPRRPGWET